MPSESLPRVRSSPASRVHAPGTFRFAVALPSQTGLTANLQGFRIGALEEWPLLQRRTSVRPTAPHSCGAASHRGAWQCRERITNLEGLRVSWTRHLARKLFVIQGYGPAGEPPLGRV